MASWPLKSKFVDMAREKKTSLICKIHLHVRKKNPHNPKHEDDKIYYKPYNWTSFVGNINFSEQNINLFKMLSYINLLGFFNINHFSFTKYRFLIKFQFRQTKPKSSWQKKEFLENILSVWFHLLSSLLHFSLQMLGQDDFSVWL